MTTYSTPAMCPCGHTVYDHDEYDDACDLCDCDEYGGEHG